MPEKTVRETVYGSFKKHAHALLYSRLMPLWLVVLSFFENTVLLVPVEPLFIPAMAMRRRWAFAYAGLLTFGCVLGALATYWIAAASFEPLVEPAMHAGGIMDDFESVRDDINERGFWALFIVGVSPIPFQLGTVGAGVVGMPLPEFVAAIALSRALRYFALAGLVYAVGWRAQDLIKRYETELIIGSLVLFVAIIVGGWAISRTL